MSDTRTPEPDRHEDRIAKPQDACGPIQLEDTPLANPLTPAQRRRLARWARAGSLDLAARLAAGPAPAALATEQWDPADWMQTLRELMRDLDRFAETIQRDEVPYSVAAKVRNLLIKDAVDHDLRAAGAALDAVLTAALPQRRAAYFREVHRRSVERGFVIQFVGGRGEPLALPSFAYSRGLGATASHPELVMVGMAPEVVSFVLNELCSQIVAGARVVRPGDEIDGVLAEPYTLRVRECPEHLVAETYQDRENPAGALQVLLPDKAGRFPGDPDVDPDLEREQTYPTHPA